MPKQPEAPVDDPTAQGGSLVPNDPDAIDPNDPNAGVDPADAGVDPAEDAPDEGYADPACLEAGVHTPDPYDCNCRPAAG